MGICGLELANLDSDLDSGTGCVARTHVEARRHNWSPLESNPPLFLLAGDSVQVTQPLSQFSDI